MTDGELGMKVVLYLDYDGVLHPENVLWHPRRGAYLERSLVTAGHRLFEHAELLEMLIEPYPELVIVLSTSWAVQFGFSRAAKPLPSGLRARVVGSTFHSGMNEQMFRALPRGHQVLADIGRRRPRRWLAVDDVDEGWTTAREHVVITDERQGISEPTVLGLLRIELTRFGE